jgi:hypothetical protein
LERLARSTIVAGASRRVYVERKPPSTRNAPTPHDVGHAIDRQTGARLCPSETVTGTLHVTDQDWATWRGHKCPRCQRAFEEFAS